MSSNWPPRPRAITFEQLAKLSSGSAGTGAGNQPEGAPPASDPRYAQPVQPGETEITSSDRDNREPPTCACGAPVYADGLCVSCHQDAAEARNRALPRHLQRD